MKTGAIGPWFIETDKDERELLNNLITDINSCLETLTMPKQSNVTIYVVLDKYAPIESTVAVSKPTPSKIIMAELIASFVKAGWNSLKDFSYNNHSLGLEVVNKFIKNKPILHYYLIQQDSKGEIKLPRKLKGSLEPINTKTNEDISEKFIG